MSELMRASREWASRPSDERFWSVADLHAKANADRLASKEAECLLGQLTAKPVGSDIAIIGPTGGETRPTNWGFSQLCRLAGAPADYLNGLPSVLACDCLNQGLKGRTDKVKVLLHRNGLTHLRAVTSDGYTRLWDSNDSRDLNKQGMCQLIQPAIDSGWKVPPARPTNADGESRPATAADLIPGMTGGSQVREGDMIAPSGVYRGDRDSFVFLVNPRNPIDDGGDGGMFKGIIASNSEVGKASIRFQGFCHEGVCGNHIIWGVSQIVEMKRKHYGDLRPFIHDLRRWIDGWTGANTAATETMIVKAKQHVLGKDYEAVEKEVRTLGLAALTIKAIAASYDYAQKWEHTAHATPNTAWGFVHGLTRYSQTLGFADQRHALDVAGGKVLGLAL